MDKKKLTEADIRSKYITPALAEAGWDLHDQIREEVALTSGRIIVKGDITPNRPTIRLVMNRHTKFQTYACAFLPGVDTWNTG